MGGKSKSATVGYWYEVAFHSGLGIGPIDAYLEFRGGDKTAWRGEATQSQTIHINAPNLWGGEKDQGGIVGAVDLMFGEAGQNPSSRLAGIFGPQQPAWRGFATLVFAGKYGAMNPYPQKASHKIRKIREGWDGECWYPGKAAIPMPTCAGEDAYSYATSVPYPLEIIEHAAVGGAITDGLLRSIRREIGDTAETAIMPALTGMTLRFPRRDLSPSIEHAVVTPALTGMTLRTTRRTAGAAPERAAVAPAITAMTLRRARIDARPPTEQAAITPSLTGISLYEP